jgi:WD40 repeat protein
MTAMVDLAVVRLRGADGQVVGGGFLVDSHRVLTCAHIVARALNLPEDSASLPDGATVRLDFPLVARGRLVSATIAMWDPPDVEGEGDVAGLELVDDPPEGTAAARLLIADELWRHEFRTFGFPSGYDNGVWASGRLLGRQAIQWVQMEDVKQTGYRIELGFSGAPVWDDELNGVVGMTVAAELRPEVRAAYLIPSNVLVDSWPVLANQAIPPCPYRGLFAFREQDASLFFGREELTDRLSDFVVHHPFAAVIGSSGSGKSSLVFAGLLPRLRQRPEWAIVSLRFGRGLSPLETLAAALLPQLEPQMSEAGRLLELSTLAEVLRGGRLAEVVDRILVKANAQSLLLVIDQFEELFALPADDRRQCISVLLEASQQREEHERSLKIALTLRSDFLSQALTHSALAVALQAASLMIGSMTREQLRQAIEGPARKQATYESGLGDRILDDVGEEQGNLPLLEFALTLLWENQTNGKLTHAAYDALDGVDGALARYAEEVFLGLPEGEREDAHQVFLQLVRPGQGTGHTRRAARREDLNEQRWLVAQRLATSRLVVTGRTAAGTETVELIHEALISQWHRLKDWVEADLAFRGWQERLRGALQQWEASGRDNGALLRGAPLAEAEAWLKQRPADISQIERAFIYASRRLQGKSVRRLQGLVAALGALVVIALISGVMVRQTSREADRQSRLAISRYLVNAADARLQAQPDLSMSLTLTAFSIAQTAEARKSLLEQLYRRRDASGLLMAHGDSVTSVAFSPDGHILASGSSDNTVILWDFGRRIPLATLQGHKGGVTSVAFSSDGQILASGGADGEIILWDVAHRSELATLRANNMPITSVAFSPDGQTLAVGSNDAEIILWDVAHRRKAAALKGHENGVTSVAFSPDGHKLASGANDHRAILWDLTKRRPLATLGPFASANSVTDVAFSPNGRVLAIATDSPDDTLVLWNVNRRKRIGSLTGGNTGTLGGNDVAFSRDGQTIASLTGSRTISLWSVPRRVRLRAYTGHINMIRDLAFSPDGHTLASASDDRTVGLFDVSNTASLGALTGEAPGQFGDVSDLAFSPDGKTLASVDNGAITVWDVAHHSRLMRIRVPKTRSSGTFSEPERITGIAFSPNSQILAASTTHKVVLWDLSKRAAANSSPVLTVLGPVPQVSSRGVAFSPDGRTVAIGGKNTTLWDVTRHIRVATLRGRNNGEIGAVAFSRDGRMLASSSSSFSEPTGTVFIWDAARRTQLAALQVEELSSGFGGSDIAFSPDSRTLAIGTERQILLWDVVNRVRLGTLSEQLGNFGNPGGSDVVGTAGGTSLAFSSNGRILASGNVLWDVARRSSLGHLGGAGAASGGATAFSPDGRILAVGGQEIVLWDMDEGLWFRRLCDITRRNLTKTEWKEFLPGRKYQQVCN